MKNVGFLITNPNHHWQLIEPIVSHLQRFEIANPILISLCGLRRMRDPITDYERLGIEYRLGPSLLKAGMNRASGSESLGSGASLRRQTAQSIAWYGWLQFSLPKLLDGLNGLLVLNDVAFPTSYLLNRFRRKNKAWLGLLQEGIRFPLPNEAIAENYAGSDLDRIFAWGESSARFFLSRRGETKAKILATGNPRINQKLGVNWSEIKHHLKAKFNAQGSIIGFASNPIDDQGFCTNAEKLKLIENFLNEALPFLTVNRHQLWIKLHPRENAEEIRTIVSRLNAADHIKLIEDPCVFSFISTVDRVVLMASTVGLESLAFGKPIAVLPIPGHGFVHDYVSKSAALGLALGKINEQLSRWQEPGLSAKAQSYVEQNLSISCESISVICETIKSDLSNNLV